MCRFSDAGMTTYPRAEVAGVRKAPRHEIADVGDGGAAGEWCRGPDRGRRPSRPCDWLWCLLAGWIARVTVEEGATFASLRIRTTLTVHYVNAKGETAHEIPARARRDTLDCRPGNSGNCRRFSAARPLHRPRQGCGRLRQGRAHHRG